MNRDTIDLTQLKCSTISLQSGLEDPADADIVEIDGNGDLTIERASSDNVRLIKHTSTNLGSRLILNRLVLSNGATNDDLAGACAFSAGGIYLLDSVVTSCSAVSNGVQATGGAIHAARELSIQNSKILNSSISTVTPSTDIRGGGAYGYTINCYDSTIEGNHLISPNTDVRHIAMGGGLFTQKLVLGYSTIAHNGAYWGGGVSVPGKVKYSHDTTVVNSTISGNTATVAGGIYAGLLINELTIYNSTITDNSASDGGGARLNAPTVVSVSSIISGNTGGDFSGGARLAGTKNLIGVSEPTVPADTILTSDPVLGPLRDNGGPTFTHAPLWNSPAINHGFNPRGLGGDQRKMPRVDGSVPDIGAVETVDGIFRGVFDLVT